MIPLHVEFNDPAVLVDLLESLVETDTLMLRDIAIDLVNDVETLKRFINTLTTITNDQVLSTMESLEQVARGEGHVVYSPTHTPTSSPKDDDDLPARLPGSSPKDDDESAGI